MAKVPIWAYYCMNSYVTSRARSTRVLQYCHFDNFVLLTSSRLDGDYVPIPAYLNKRHRQQNKEILIKHSPGMGEYFWFSGIQITEKNFHQERSVIGGRRNKFLREN